MIALVAFVGGLLSLFSPCSAMLLPAFFAYAFPSPARLALRTAVFYAGMLVVLVPMGIGAGSLGGALLQERGPLMLLAGIVLVAIGVLQFVRGGFEIGPSGAWRPMSAERAASTFVLGLGYGLGGFCAGPILGAILTLAATSGGALPGALLLAVYAAGMAAPLFALALVWDRLGARWRGRLRGRELRIGPIQRHSSTVVSSVLFVVLGIGFIAFPGTNPLAGVYTALGLDTGVLQLEADIQSLSVDPVMGIAVLAVAVVLAAVAVSRHRRAA